MVRDWTSEESRDEKAREWVGRQVRGSEGKLDRVIWRMVGR